MTYTTNGTNGTTSQAPRTAEDTRMQEIPRRPWEDLSLIEQQERMLTEFTPPQWLTDEGLVVGAILYQKGARLWYHWKAQAKERGVDIYGYQRAVEQLLTDLGFTPTPEAPAASGDPPLRGKALWDQALSAAEFIAQHEAEIPADARDLLLPGCITVIAAPRASCKSLVALYLAVALAQGGTFRGEQVPKRRVLLVDRDNAPALIKKRLAWLGADTLPYPKVLTRTQAPPLTDAEAWAACPVEDYDVIIVDSLGTSTEGVSEKEGKQTQLYLATLKDLAMRGPAILVLDNTNKAGLNYRGRGEKGDAVDIIYEARNITGWTPTHGGNWWEDLPDFGEHTWQERATRRTGQTVLHIAFVPSKFRGGLDPEPFVLAIDTTQAPWTLDDITEDIATAGQRAAEETARLERAKLLAAETALCAAIGARDPAQPMLKREAENFLCAHGLRQKVARTLLMSGGNRDIYPQGRWVLRDIPGVRGKPTGVYLAGEEDHNQNNPHPKSPHADAGSDPLISVDGSTPSNQNTTPLQPAENLGETSTLFGLQPGYTPTEINLNIDKENGWCPGGGIISVGDPPSNDIAEPCLHEHVNDLGVCNDCGEILDEGGADGFHP
jgi:hypothetical protein